MRYLALALALAACSSPDAIPPTPCNPACAVGQTCIAGRCFVEADGDAGAVDAAVGDVGLDAPPAEVGVDAAGPDAAVGDAAPDVTDGPPDVGADATADAAPCGAGRADCDGDPSNGCEATLATDPSNCGTCRTACGGGAFCRDARCVCLAGRDRCGADCVTLAIDNANCGACGHRCTSRETCVNGMCITR